MKKIVSGFYFVGFLIVTFYANVQAQEESSRLHFGLSGGVSVPVGAFANSKGNETDGFAKTGYSFMLEGQFNLNESVHWVTSASITSNSFSNDAYAYHVGGSISAGSYHSYWLMSGFGFDLINAGRSKLFGICQAGILIPSFPDISYSNYGYSMEKTGEGKVTFAYSFGAGIRLDRFSITVRYYASDPEFDMLYNSGWYGEKRVAMMPQHLLQIMMGINF